MDEDTRPCARCHVEPRNGSSKSYCRECQRILARESTQRRQERGRTLQSHCSRCGGERTGVHPSYCTSCFRAWKHERLAGPCGRCGRVRADGDQTNHAYCYDCWRGWWLKRKYGLTPEQFDALLVSQDGRCALCRIELVVRTAHVDHDHVTKHVRGVLCHNCNIALGHFHDDPALLRRAADYLESSLQPS